MANFLLIAICIFAGILFRKYGTLPKDAHRGINAWIINIALPAVSFKYLPTIHFRSELIFPLVSPIIIWCCGWMYFVWYAKKQQLNKATLGGLKLTGSLSNTSFIGFPLVIAYFSEKEIATAILCDQVTFALLSTIGIVVAIRSAGNERLDLLLVFKKVFTFPPIWGFILALSIPRVIDISALHPLFDKLAATVGPLALFSIGLQLKFGGWFAEIKHISIALLYKLIFAPLLVMLAAVALGLTGMVPKIAIFEAAMPTLLTSGIVATQYNLNPKLSNLIVGVSIVFCFFTTSIWWAILTYSGWL
jgi:predicted permease